MNLALLGKDIQHSGSPALYQKLCKEDIHYHLLDFNTPEEIPPLGELFDQYSLNGLSITAPYKTHFFNDVHLERKNIITKIGGINCIYKRQGVFYGENTDEMAFREEFLNLKKSKDFEKVILLGDGVMAKMIKTILYEYDIEPVQFSRKLNGEINNLSFKLEDSKSCLMINACSRSYVYKGPFSTDIHFWDMNYDMKAHSDNIPKYTSGEKLLMLQAQHALKFFTQI